MKENPLKSVLKSVRFDPPAVRWEKGCLGLRSKILSFCRYAIMAEKNMNIWIPAVEGAARQVSMYAGHDSCTRTISTMSQLGENRAVKPAHLHDNCRQDLQQRLLTVRQARITLKNSEIRSAQNKYPKLACADSRQTSFLTAPRQLRQGNVTHAANK